MSQGSRRNELLYEITAVTRKSNLAKGVQLRRQYLGAESHFLELRMLQITSKRTAGFWEFELDKKNVQALCREDVVPWEANYQIFVPKTYFFVSAANKNNSTGHLAQRQESKNVTIDNCNSIFMVFDKISTLFWRIKAAFFNKDKTICVHLLHTQLGLLGHMFWGFVFVASLVVVWIWLCCSLQIPHLHNTA